MKFLESIELEFSDGRDKGLNTVIDFCSGLSAETTTDLHFGLGWSYVPFCLITGRKALRSGKQKPAQRPDVWSDGGRGFSLCLSLAFRAVFVLAAVLPCRLVAANPDI